jgi:hypothetical protein
MADAEIPIAESEKGFVIGKGGSNIKRLQAESGARIVIVASCVRISGQPAAVDRARMLIKSQLATHRLHTTSYEHPTITIQLVDPRMLTHAVSLVLAPVQDEPSETYRLELPAIAAAAASSRGSEAAAAVDADALADQLSKTALTLNPKRAFYAWDDRETIRSVLASAVGAAANAAAPAAAAMRTKVRFNVGRQMFYAHKGQGMPSLSAGLASAQIGFDGGAMRAVFSNRVSASEATAISARLGTLGLKIVERRETVSCHLEDQLTRRALGVRFVVPAVAATASTTSNPAASGNNVLLEVARTKTANRRHCFVSLCNADPQGLDVRFKLISNGPLDASVDAVVRAEIEGARWTASTLRMPALRSYLCDKARRKSKTVYEGDHAGTTFRVSIVVVEDETGEHHEVAGTSLAWNRNLVDVDAYVAAVRFTQALAGWPRAAPTTQQS